MGTELSFPQGVIKTHHTLSQGQLPAAPITLSLSENWDFGPELFLDGFSRTETHRPGQTL